jgi:two-component system LytT family response regulator
MDQIIRTIIIDDNKDFLESLREHLSIFPDIEVCGISTIVSKAKKLVATEKPDLIFLDIEMPGKSGFELLDELRKEVNFSFDVVFYTAYDKYIIKALREAAFDYLIKPVNASELRSIIERYIIKCNTRVSPITVTSPIPFSHEIISLPANTGLQFLDKNSIVLFQCRKEGVLAKPYWEVLLNNRNIIKLKTNTTAKEIIAFLKNSRFLQISQSAIVNAMYLNIIEFKTRDCILVPPFQDIRLTVSRNYMTELKDQCDLL